MVAPGCPLPADGAARVCYIGFMDAISNTDRSEAASRRFRTLWLPLALFACVAVLAPVYVAALEAHGFDMTFLTSICGISWK